MAMFRGSLAVVRQTLVAPSATTSRTAWCSTCSTRLSTTTSSSSSSSAPSSSRPLHSSSRVLSAPPRPPPRLPARTAQPTSNRPDDDPNDGREDSDADDTYDSLYSSRYRGQGAKSSVPPWYKSPPLILLGIMPLFTLGLGVWQVKRLDWKLGLIEELEYKLTRDPIRLPKNINLSVLPEFEFRLVDVSGTFDHSRAMFLGPRVRDGVVGYHVVVPLMRDCGGGQVLVDRGFVSERVILKDAETGERRLRWEDEAVAPRGSVTLTALLPRLSGPNMFQPRNEPQRGLWFWPHPEGMAAWASHESDPDDSDAYTPSAGVRSSVQSMLGLASSPSSEPHTVLPVYLEEIFNGYDASYRVERGIPIGRAATIELRNQHAVYAATWFALSAATAGMFALLLRTRRVRAAGKGGSMGGAERMGRRVRREL